MVLVQGGIRLIVAVLAGWEDEATWDGCEDKHGRSDGWYCV